ncbi:TetR/AcrR family transcriptional regulator [Corynebacterium durum]|uniref:TetR/AcrR family transcriptional regulator n=1 Tax=Corynebacterium durum TaxID=61592 RepID=UPI0028F06B53|nr:TetR/AcrR family transcriptional regulator [Corynebacterium durum]
MRSDALARRIRIIEAACEIFRTSIDIVPLETIADKAGVGIATLYRNFPDRTALIHACAAYMFDKVIELQQSVLERFDSDPGAEWFRYVKTLVELGIAPLVSTLAPDDFQDVPADITRIRAVASAHGSQIMAKAQEHGLVVKGIGHETFIIGLITVARPPAPGVSALDPDIVNRLVGLYLSGLHYGPLPDWAAAL